MEEKVMSSICYTLAITNPTCFVWRIFTDNMSVVPSWKGTKCAEFLSPSKRYTTVARFTPFSYTSSAGAESAAAETGSNSLL